MKSSSSEGGKERVRALFSPFCVFFFFFLPMYGKNKESFSFTATKNYRDLEEQQQKRRQRKAKFINREEKEKQQIQRFAFFLYLNNNNNNNNFYQVRKKTGNWHTDDTGRPIWRKKKNKQTILFHHNHNYVFLVLGITSLFLLSLTKKKNK